MPSTRSQRDDEPAFRSAAFRPTASLTDTTDDTWFARSVGNDQRVARRTAWRRHPRRMLRRALRAKLQDKLPDGLQAKLPDRWRGTATPDPIENPATTNAEILERLEHLPIGYWTYGWEEAEVRHLGPMAQDFWNAFGLGDTDRKINTIDGQGVLIASVQALLQRVKELERRVAELEGREHPEP